MAVTNKKTEKILRRILKKDGFQTSQIRKRGENGVDIIAEKNLTIYHIEVIGYKKSGSARARDFFEVFFRIISRIKDGAKICVIALTDPWRKGLPARARQYGEAWERIGKAFPELHIWLIDMNDGTYKDLDWNGIDF